ncbi:MAG: YcaO-related McrA-glycine thioamidation protein [Methanobrevibacter sp.]|uniref:YcaO-related McrA-glycine thioamidation protein n=1 Tax=Methanobrevibacter sp. TaxID=66852 RepID=UPI0025F1788D|nr:YcaO-related McrA-glycine thioamidation protein [Methanobrevibacter sp.]MBR3112776.1 YcaO-related McrA-glycine thioamidation protein [Methanobrevibacter sp.]MBR6992651.1 YcaO-related McrA-glycine thioamidation protein [Methanobrevibacter sp.]
MTDELTYFKGTHRVIAPKKTIEINEDKLKIAGITRIADITDLDRIGLPIYTAIRPTAEDGAISIYGGKGITKDHAKASAMMEGFERYSAEKQDGDEVIVANIKEISERGEYIDPVSLNLPKDFKKENIEEMQLEWSIAKDIISDEEFYIPTNAIYHPYLHDNQVQSLFKSNTNGLASGNVLEEAILHGMLEVIERDAWSIFELTHKNYAQIDLDSIESETVNDILEKFESEGIKIKLMDFTADVKIPTIAASADDTVTKDAGLLTLGMGTHLDPEVAILRALTEVAQSRATQINGAREDTVRADFAREAGYERMKRINKFYFRDEEEKIKLSDIENKSTSSITKDIEIVKNELMDNDIDKILYVDLTRPELDVSVVRVIIPEMELFALDPSRAGYRFLKV